MADNPSHQIVESKMPVETRNFTWKIAHFGKFRSVKELVDLQEFPFEMGSSIGLPTKWTCFLMYHESIDQKDWIGLWFKVDKASTGNASKVLTAISFKIDDGKYFNLRGPIQDILSDNGGLGYNKLIPARPSEDEKVLPLGPNETLSLDIQVDLLNFDAALALKDHQNCSSVHTLVSAFDTKFSERLRKDFFQAFKNPCSSSSVPMMVRIISNDNKEFTVNRGILAARSPVFCSMFETKMREANDGVVKVDDISGKSLEAVLMYIHTGSLPENCMEQEILEGLIYAADKYLLEDLKMFLDQALGLMCTAQNCGKWLSLARTLNMTKAEKTLLKFCKNHLKDASLEDTLEFFRKVESNEWE